MLSKHPHSVPPHIILISDECKNTSCYTSFHTHIHTTSSHIHPQSDSQDWWFSQIAGHSKSSLSHRSEPNSCVCACLCPFQLFSPTRVMEWITAHSSCVGEDACSTCVWACIDVNQHWQSQNVAHSSPWAPSHCFNIRLDPLPVFTTELQSRCWDTSQALQAKDVCSNKPNNKKTHAGASGMTTSHQHKCSQWVGGGRV